jgi:hypothetical protein
MTTRDNITINYRNYVIYYDPPPIPSRTCDWHYYHEDYDGAEDANDHRCGSGPSEQWCKNEIDAALAENEPEEFAIISTPIGFEFAELSYRTEHEIFFRINGEVLGVAKKDIVAIYTNAVFCKQQLGKAKDIERRLRPLWQAAIEHERHVRNLMLEQVYAIAKENEIK